MQKSGRGLRFTYVNVTDSCSWWIQYLVILIYVKRFTQEQIGSFAVQFYLHPLISSLLVSWSWLWALENTEKPSPSLSLPKFLQRVRSCRPAVVTALHFFVLLYFFKPSLLFFRALHWHHCHSHHIRGNWLDKKAILSVLCLHWRQQF